MTLQNQLYNSLPVGVFIFDIETQTIQEWGPHSTILLGFDRATMLGKPLNFLVQDTRQLLEAANQLGVKDATDIAPVDVRIYSPNGVTRTYNLRVFTVEVSGRNYVGCSVIAQAETDRLLASLRSEISELKTSKQSGWNERRADSELRMWEVRSQERIAITMIRFVFGTMAVLTILSTISFVSSQIINSTYDLLIYFAGVISGLLGAKQLYQGNTQQPKEKDSEGAIAPVVDPYSRERVSRGDRTSYGRERGSFTEPVDRPSGGADGLY